MFGKLKDYQVIDVFCGGTFYKVRHKVTNNIFAWKAYDCSTYADEQIQNVVNEVKTISKLSSDNLLRYYETILHEPTKTLYFVLEYNSWRNLRELIEECKATGKYFSEGFIWRLLHELARVHKLTEDIKLNVLSKCITPEAIFVNGKGEVRVNCFDLTSTASEYLVRQIAEVIRTLCYRPGECDDKIKEFHYSDDLSDIISFLLDDRNTNMRPEVVLYHPTVLTNLEIHPSPENISGVLVSGGYSHTSSEVNKCDSEKAVEMCRVVEPLPRTHFNVHDSPIYMNITPKVKENHKVEKASLSNGSLSPTLAALALELPGYVPRSRRPYTGVLEEYHCPQKVSEDTLSEQWMSRLIVLRQREASLNKRERDLIAKEIVNSPSTKIIPLNDTQELVCEGDSNGITLPPMITHAKDGRREGTARRRQRRSSVRSKGRRKSCGYEDLDSSLSADPGDSSIVITATKFTKENMPRRNIFPEVSTKKVHFTAANPFTESDESVTLTFYELESGQQVSKQGKDMEKFKYLDLEKLSEKRSAIAWCHSSPSKQAKISNVFGDITNHSSIRKTPSKTSLTSNSSRFSMMSARSQWSEDSCGKARESTISERTRASIRQSLAQTPTAPEMGRSKSRKSLLHFKTPFKFISSTKI